MLAMSRFGSQYQVARPTGQCTATGRQLEPGEECVATLCEREEDEGFDRHDFSLEAWNEGERPPRLFSYWKTTVPHPQEKREVFVDDDVLIELFERLGEDDRPQRQAFRFVLVLILMRKRVLRFLGRREREAPESSADSPDAAPQQETWLFEYHSKARRTDEPMEVINPHLTDDDIRELTSQLSEILQGEL